MLNIGCNFRNSLSAFSSFEYASSKPIPDLDPISASLSKHGGQQGTGARGTDFESSGLLFITPLASFPCSIDSMLDNPPAGGGKSSSGGKSAMSGPLTGENPSIEGEACGDRRGSLRALGNDGDGVDCAHGETFLRDAVVFPLFCFWSMRMEGLTGVSADERVAVEVMVVLVHDF
jgi:hypothetical protein